MRMGKGQVDQFQRQGCPHFESGVSGKCRAVVGCHEIELSILDPDATRHVGLIEACHKVFCCFFSGKLQRLSAEK